MTARRRPISPDSDGAEQDTPETHLPALKWRGYVLYPIGCCGGRDENEAHGLRASGFPAINVKERGWMVPNNLAARWLARHDAAKKLKKKGWASGAALREATVLCMAKELEWNEPLDTLRVWRDLVEWFPTETRTALSMADVTERDEARDDGEAA